MLFVSLQQFITQTRFVCQFNIEGRVTSVNANLLSDTIYCDTMEFAYGTAAPSTNATFAVIWGGSKPLDNPDNIHGECLFFLTVFFHLIIIFSDTLSLVLSLFFINEIVLMI